MVLQCPPGQFIHGSVQSESVKCVDGDWQFVGGQIAGTSVGCREGCSSPCRNAGVCIGVDTCMCPQGYEGNFCELKSCVDLSFNVMFGRANLR